MPKKLSETEIKNLIELYNSGLSAEKISEITGNKAQTITNYLKQCGIEIRGPKKKLTEDDKKEIYRLYKEEKLSMKKIAEKYNVSDVAILKIIKKQKTKKNSKKIRNQISYNYNKTRKLRL